VGKIAITGLDINDQLSDKEGIDIVALSKFGV
jgi:hypothetical protein